MAKTRLLLITLALLALSCKHQTERAFYYWKSVYKTSPALDNFANGLEIKKLYIRFFDVDWNESASIVAPRAKIRFSQKVGTNHQIIPVVYIVNRSLQKTQPGEIANLSEKILKLADKIASNNKITFQELQIDCDWTESTREKYFGLLSHLKSLLNVRNIALSSTIRLHQVKYKKITGIPPVDRGMLMYYNMGKITADISSNSIFNTQDAEKYDDYIADYPLPLDVALPVFSWGIHIRNNRVISLLNTINRAYFEENPGFTKLDGHFYMANKSFFYRGFYFIKGDQVKVEEISPKDCQIAAKQLKSKVKAIGTVALFHLDSLTISRYEKENFEKVFNYFP